MAVAAQCSAAVAHLHIRGTTEETQHQPVPDAAPAGLSDSSEEPALLQLDQQALNRVFTKLEPEALALAGSC